MTRRRTAAWSLAALLTVGTLAACGVPVQQAAEPLPSNVLPAPLHIPRPAASASAAPSTMPSASAAPSSSASPIVSTLRLWFVQQDGLAAADSALPVGTAPDVIVQSLAVGPTGPQAADGLRTVARDPLTGLALVAVPPPTESEAGPTVTAAPLTSALPASGPPDLSSAPASPPVIDGGPPPVTVRLSSAFTALPPTEQVLLLGQVVLSLTGAGFSSVAFADEAGTPVAVPLPDGRLLDVPATARDYNSLIIRP